MRSEHPITWSTDEGPVDLLVTVHRPAATLADVVAALPTGTGRPPIPPTSVTVDGVAHPGDVPAVAVLRRGAVLRVGAPSDRTCRRPAPVARDPGHRRAGRRRQLAAPARGARDRSGSRGGAPSTTPRRRGATPASPCRRPTRRRSPTSGPPTARCSPGGPWPPTARRRGSSARSRSWAGRRSAPAPLGRRRRAAPVGARAPAAAPARPACRAGRPPNRAPPAGADAAHASPGPAPSCPWCSAWSWPWSSTRACAWFGLTGPVMVTATWFEERRRVRRGARKAAADGRRGRRPAGGRPRAAAQAGGRRLAARAPGPTSPRSSTGRSTAHRRCGSAGPTTTTPASSGWGSGRIPWDRPRGARRRVARRCRRSPWRSEPGAVARRRRRSRRAPGRWPGASSCRPSCCTGPPTRPS